MATKKAKKETRSRKQDSREGRSSQDMRKDIKNISSMSEERFSTRSRSKKQSHIGTNSSSNISTSQAKDERSPSPMTEESGEWISSSHGEAKHTEIPKTSSEQSQTHSSHKTSTSQDHSTSHTEKPEGSMYEYHAKLPEPMKKGAPDLLYILGRGSKWRDNEIRFSLRSVEKYLPHARVWIIGECPPFLKNVVHIPAIDPYEVKTANAIFKIRTACREIDLSEEFILMNDDFFMLRAVQRVEPMTLGTLKESIQNHSTKAGYYYAALRATNDLLKQSGIDEPIDYEVHAPMLFEKQKFLSVTDAVDWRDGYLHRSLYGNTFEIGGKKRKDTKAYLTEDLERLTEGDIISTADRVVLHPEFQHFITRKFPNPSRYEKEEMDPGLMP